MIFLVYSENENTDKYISENINDSVKISFDRLEKYEKRIPQGKTPNSSIIISRVNDTNRILLIDYLCDCLHYHKNIWIVLDSMHIFTSLEETLKDSIKLSPKDEKYVEVASLYFGKR